MTREAAALDAQLCFALHGASRLLTRAYRTVLEPLGLTYPQYLVLLALRDLRAVGPDGPAPSVAELGARLWLDSATLTPLLKRLAEAGYVERSRDPSDERVVRVRLGPRAIEADAALRSIPGRMLASAPLPVERLVRLRDDARALAEGLATQLGEAGETDETGKTGQDRVEPPSVRARGRAAHRVSR